MKSAVVAGSLTLDITMVMDPDNPHSAGPLFRQGKLTFIDGVRFYLGGCVGNTGLAMRRLGVPVRLISKIGEDDAAGIITAILASEDADARIQTDAIRGSACGIALTPPGQDKISFFCRGASQYFRAEDLDGDALAGASLFHFGYPTAMPTMYENGGAELERVLNKVKRAGLAVSLDTSLPDILSDAAQADWPGILERCLPLIDLFAPSLEELLFMLDRELYIKMLETAGKDDMLLHLEADRVPELAGRCLALGAGAVLVKAGRRGLYFRSKADAQGLAALTGGADWLGRELWRPATQVDRIVSATGAGDTAIAGFLAALLNGDNPETALRLATQTALKCLGSGDTVSGIGPMAEMLAFPVPPALPLDLEPDWHWRTEDGLYVREA